MKKKKNKVAYSKQILVLWPRSSWRRKDKNVASCLLLVLRRKDIRIVTGSRAIDFRVFRRSRPRTGQFWNRLRAAISITFVGVSALAHSTLLEKRFIRTPDYQYWCRLVTVANTNNGWLTSRYQ
jgi:hypothetical protein